MAEDIAEKALIPYEEYHNMIYFITGKKKKKGGGGLFK